MNAKKVYEGFRDDEGVVVRVNGILLHPQQSQALYNHSPNGFEWGYGGSGPSQLALAILLEYTGDTAVALRLYQRFKEEIIAKLPKDKLGFAWSMDGAVIDQWLGGFRP